MSFEVALFLLGCSIVVALLLWGSLRILRKPPVE
jgi:hypothetical protein